MADVFGWRAAAVLALGLLSAGAARAAAPCPGLPADGTPRYAGRVAYYVADLKPSFEGNKSYSARSALTPDNYRAVLDGLKAHVGANGVRLPIFPQDDASQYSKLYHDVVDHARSLGFLIYANPSAVGKGPFKVDGRDWTDERYASWLVDYAKAFRPDVLSPFNEAARSDADMIGIVKLVRAKLKAEGLAPPMQLMGPDGEHVAYSLKSLENPDLVRSFDMIGSHNAGSDKGDTAGQWKQLVAAAGGRPVWSSENPAPWVRVWDGRQLGMDQAMEGGVSGIVSWMAKPDLVDDAGNPTPKACAIAARLVR